MTLALKVRKILREGDLSNMSSTGGAIYNNKYKNCRTIKAYLVRKNRDNLPAVEEALAQLAYNEGVEITTKIIDFDPGSYMGNVSSYIVRIPLLEE